MADGMVSRTGDAPGDRNSFAVVAPKLELPKGGGAIRGIGEKFAANRVTGTGTLAIPLAVSPGRSGFGPALSLSYDSGAGNGAFGLGWTCELPRISRKTDRGLPRYDDAADSDVFLLSGAEDLVPTLVESGASWVSETVPPRVVGTDEYHIRRYRPRIEGLFARIERWTRSDGLDVFWRSISRDNVTTYYGSTTESRIYDPADPTRIFAWLISESYDDTGNVIRYEYIEEDSAGVDTAAANEQNRTDVTRSANRYLKRVRYGNTPSRLDPAYTKGVTWHFEVVFDYGEEHYAERASDVDGRVYAIADVDPAAPTPWPARLDPFSTYRAGFEMRAYRLCQRVLMFHRFAELDARAGGKVHPYLVRSTDFTHRDDTDAASDKQRGGLRASFLQSVTRRATAKEDGTRSLPPLEFATYSAGRRSIADESREDSIRKARKSPRRSRRRRTYQWIDLDSEGLSEVLTEQADGWYYKREP